MKQKALKKISKAMLTVLLVILFTMYPLIGCKRVLPAFTDFAAVWSCDYDDIKLEIISNSRDCLLNGKLSYNDKKYDVIINAWYWVGYGLEIYDANIISFSEYQSCDSSEESRDLREKKEKAFLFKASCEGYRRKLTLTIVKDNLSPDQSLVDRKLVLKKSEIPIPQE